MPQQVNNSEGSSNNWSFTKVFTAIFGFLGPKKIFKSHKPSNLDPESIRNSMNFNTTNNPGINPNSVTQIRPPPEQKEMDLLSVQGNFKKKNNWIKKIDDTIKSDDPNGKLKPKEYSQKLVEKYGLEFTLKFIKFKSEIYIENMNKFIKTPEKVLKSKGEGRKIIDSATTELKEIESLLRINESIQNNYTELARDPNTRASHDFNQDDSLKMAKLDTIHTKLNEIITNSRTVLSNYQPPKNKNLTKIDLNTTANQFINQQEGRTIREKKQNALNTLEEHAETIYNEYHHSDTEKDELNKEFKNIIKLVKNIKEELEDSISDIDSYSDDTSLENDSTDANNFAQDYKMQLQAQAIIEKYENF